MIFLDQSQFFAPHIATNEIALFWIDRVRQSGQRRLSLKYFEMKIALSEVVCFVII